MPANRKSGPANKEFYISGQSYQGVLTTVPVRLDLLYKLFRGPWTLFSVTTFFISTKKPVTKPSKLEILKRFFEYNRTI